MGIMEEKITSNNINISSPVLTEYKNVIISKDAYFLYLFAKHFEEYFDERAHYYNTWDKSNVKKLKARHIDMKTIKHREEMFEGCRSVFWSIGFDVDDCVINNRQENASGLMDTIYKKAKAAGDFEKILSSKSALQFCYDYFIKKLDNKKTDNLSYLKQRIIGSFKTKDAIEEGFPMVYSAVKDVYNQNMEKLTPKKEQPFVAKIDLSRKNDNSLMKGLKTGERTDEEIDAEFRRLNIEPLDEDYEGTDGSKLVPKTIKAKLDEYVIGQTNAKKVLSNAVYYHYQRVAYNLEYPNKDGVELDKDNILLVGPTGSGKTFMVEQLSKLFDVPFVKVVASDFTANGYKGQDVNEILQSLLQKAQNDVEKAERGIVYIDEIDKISTKDDRLDIGGTSIQQQLLGLIEGSDVKFERFDDRTINTKNILFICGGAFDGIETLIKHRQINEGTYKKENNLLDDLTSEDLTRFGMIPEFLGRLPSVVTLDKLTKEDFKSILTKPKNSILKQYKRYFEIMGKQLEFSEEAIDKIAELASEDAMGARSLKKVISKTMVGIMHEAPSDNKTKKFIIKEEDIEK
ncbi:MAG: ATP-dependent Clp protease ATP-binding subunit ClpX [Spirochaetales bacterium]